MTIRRAAGVFAAMALALPLMAGQALGAVLYDAKVAVRLDLTEIRGGDGTAEGVVTPDVAGSMPFGAATAAADATGSPLTLTDLFASPLEILIAASGNADAMGNAFSLTGAFAEVLLLNASTTEDAVFVFELTYELLSEAVADDPLSEEASAFSSLGVLSSQALDAIVDIALPTETIAGPGTRSAMQTIAFSLVVAPEGSASLTFFANADGSLFSEAEGAPEVPLPPALALFAPALLALRRSRR